MKHRRVDRGSAVRDHAAVARAGPGAAAADAAPRALAGGEWQSLSRGTRRSEEDASRLRTGHAPASDAALNNLALAIVVLRPHCDPASGPGPFHPRHDMPAAQELDHAAPG